MRHHRPLRYISLFSGIEAASVAAEPLGWEPVCFCEIDPFPSAVLAHHYPNVPNLGDITKVDWKEVLRKYGSVDVVVGGSPCFPAGALVLCEGGFKPIEEVRVGERVVTHKGNLKRVMAVGSKVSDTVMLKGQGSVGIECTPNHPFFSRTKSRVWDNDKREHIMKVDESSEWVEAKDMQGRYWLNVCDVERSEIPQLGKFGKGERGSGYISDFEFTPSFFYFVGRWLGDGWANAHKRKGRVESLMKRVYVCCSHDEGDDLQAKLAETGLHFGRSDNGSTERFTCSSTQLHDWIVGNFGTYADGKNMPAWCFGMDTQLKRAMLQGYLDADGTVTSNGYKSTSINRKLSVGMKMLAASCGMTMSVSCVMNDRDAVIDGRHVNERPNYVSSYYKNPRSSFFADCGYYGLVRSVDECRKNVIVYNLEVEDDNSYTVDAVAVHNCQSFSVAGKREGLAGASGLMFEYIRAISEILPKYWVWENVPGALSSSRGADFECFLREMAGIRGAGGERYGIGYRVLDAQFFRVAQRRRRLYAIGVLGDLAGPCEILFESEGLLWNTPSSKQKREALAADARGGSRGAGGCAVGFAQNQHDKVRLIGGDGQVSGALAAQRWGNHKNETLLADPIAIDYKQTPKFNEQLCHTLTHEGDGGIHSAVAEPIVMASAHTNAEIGEGGVTPTLIAHIAKDAPVLATAQMCSQPSATFDDTTVIDRAAYNQGENAAYPPHIEQTDVMDTLVARGPHAVGYSCQTETM